MEASETQCKYSPSFVLMENCIKLGYLKMSLPWYQYPAGREIQQGHCVQVCLDLSVYHSFLLGVGKDPSWTWGSYNLESSKVDLIVTLQPTLKLEGGEEAKITDFHVAFEESGPDFFFFVVHHGEEELQFSCLASGKKDGHDSSEGQRASLLLRPLIWSLIF